MTHPKRTMLIVFLLATLLVGPPARADYGWADSVDFALDLRATPLGGHCAWSDSTDFTLDARRVGRGWSDSADFALFSGQPMLDGCVRSWITSAPIPGAQVTVQGQTATTDPNGYFRFGILQPGTTSLTVTAAGYYDHAQTVSVQNGSTTYVNIQLIPTASGTGPAVLDIRSQYCGRDRAKVYYLGGVSLSQTFTVQVDWRTYTPGTVQWITPKGTYTDPCPGTSVSRTFNMGADFGPCGTLTVIAFSAGSPPVPSAPLRANLKVIPPPSMQGISPTALLVPVSDIHALEYKILGLEGVNLELATWEPGRIPTGIPFFGGTKMTVGAELDLSGMVRSDGTMELFSFGVDAKTKKTIRKGVPCRKGMKLPFVELAPSFTLDAKLTWSDELNDWRPGGSMELGVTGTGTGPEVPLSMLTGIPVLHFIYVRGEASLTLALEGELAGWGVDGPQYQASVQFEPLVKAVVGAGIAHVASIEGYGGGGFHAGLDLYPQVAWQRPYVILLIGYRAVVGGVFVLAQGELRYTWPDQAGSVPVLSADQIYRGPGICLLPRDYLETAGTPGSLPAIAADGLPGGCLEQPIAQSVFPYPTPKLATAGADVLGVWVTDAGPVRSSINRTQLVFARYTGGAWGAATPVADDGAADLNPHLVSLPTGDTVCIWQKSNAILDDSADLTTFLSHLEIMVSTYSAAGGTWSAPARLTTNDTLDRSPCLAAASPTDMLAAWVNNAANDTFGSATASNSIMWSRFDGTAWTAPAALATGLATLLDVTLAYNGTTGTLVYAADGDDNLDTTSDQELWAATYTGGVWTAPVRLTWDSIVDAAPRLMYDTTGVLRLAWLKGDDYRMCVGTDVANSAVVVTPGESMGSKDCDLVSGAGGRLAFLWNDASAAGSDLYAAYYDPVLAAWSTPRQLTNDDACERFPSGAFDAAGNLMCIYDKNHTAYEDRQEIVDGQPVTVRIPKAGQSDLYYLLQQMKADVAVDVKDFDITPENPTPGSPATLSAKVTNRGESPVANVQVAFYDGNPAAGGVLIGATQTIPGPMGGGAGATASVVWNVPSPPATHTLYVVVDPSQLLDDRDRTNNTASFSTMRADLQVQSITVQTAGNDRIVTMRVANAGPVPTPLTQVVVHRDAPDGPVLHALDVQAIDAGAYEDVFFQWPNPFAASGRPITICATVDAAEAIDEFDETNNTRTARVTYVIPPGRTPGDVDGDGHIDVGDLLALAITWSLPSANPAFDPRCDFNTDDIVDISDLLMLAENWDGSALPGDINGDGHVDASDLLILSGSFGNRFGEQGYNPRCDLNGSGAVDVSDLLVLAGNWGA